METLKRELTKMDKQTRLNILEKLQDKPKDNTIVKEKFVKKTTILTFD